MQTKTHEARFDIYCKTCKFQKIKETDEPCNECLTNPVNIDSRKPTRYQEA